VPITSWLMTPATATLSPELVDRNAAKAPAINKVVSACASPPPTIRSGRLSTTASPRPLAARSAA